VRESEDAFGRMLLDHLEGRRAHEVIERSDGHVDVTDGPQAYFDRFRHWAPVERRAMRFVRGRVLDVGVGAGRVALHLQERGHEVVGIDNSPLSVEVARRRGVKDVRVLAFYDIGPELGVFDTVVMMCNNFGLFGSAAGARRMLRRLRRLTSTDARIVAGSRDPYLTDNPDHLGYHEQNRSRGRMTGQLRLRTRHGLYRGAWFDYLLVSPDEMHELAAAGGWQVQRLVESDDKDPSYYVGILRKR
jgi:SAM-dependent methyltransferase